MGVHDMVSPTFLDRTPRAAPIRDRRRQKVGILADALAHRHIVISLRDKDLSCDDCQIDTIDFAEG
jgi:hypothetical protein